MKNNRKTRVLLLMAGRHSYEVAERVFLLHGCEVTDDLNESKDCDLVIFDAFFAHAGLKDLAIQGLCNKPFVLFGTADQIGNCGPCDDVLLVNSNDPIQMLKIMMGWIRDSFHLLLINPVKTCGNDYWTGLALDEAELTAAY